jgi:hypothetical protein
MALGGPVFGRWLLGWSLFPEPGFWRWAWWGGAVLSFLVILWFMWPTGAAEKS